MQRNMSHFKQPKSSLFAKRKGSQGSHANENEELQITDRTQANNY